ncbi:MAG: periplasmic heavy metal sensor [Verrucomicrobiota bacterium]
MRTLGLFPVLTWLALGLGISESVSAQNTNSPRPAIPAPGQGLFIAGLGPVGNVLTDEQRNSFRMAMDLQRDRVRELEAKLRNARGRLIEESLGESFDETKARQQAVIVSGLEAELTVLRARALRQVQPGLSADQLKKIREGIGGVQRPAPLTGPAGERQHHLTSTNRDENDLPRKK